MFSIAKRRLPLLYLFLFSTFHGAFAQQTQQQRKLAYNSFMQQYHARTPTTLMLAARRDTLVHPYALVTARFVQDKVYPDRDALELIQALNPRIKMSNPNTRINTTEKLVTPHFTEPTAYILQRFNQEYIVASAPDPQINAAFENTRQQFKMMIEIMARIQNPPFSATLFDSLTLLSSNFFPLIAERVGQISKTQMSYINNEVRTLIRLFGYLSKKSTMRPAPAGILVEERKSFIVKDLFNLSNISSWSSLLPSKKMRHTGGVASYHTGKYYFKPDATTGSLADRPFKCNVYVFGTDPKTGVTAAEPVPDRYYLWLGDKASFDDLIPGCDSSAIGFPRNGNRASTLPVTIGFGTYIIIVKDRINGSVLTKEVSIGTETEFEQKDDTIRKIIFLIN